MNDGQHLNDSLIDFFVSMLVAHPVTREENMATERKSMEIISCHWALTRSNYRSN
jgi:Ulp1 family protease